MNKRRYFEYSWKLRTKKITPTKMFGAIIFFFSVSQILYKRHKKEKKDIRIKNSTSTRASAIQCGGFIIFIGGFVSNDSV